VTDPSRKQLQRRLGGIAGHVPAEWPVNFAGIRKMDRISQALTGRVKELAERYESPVPRLVSRVAEAEAKVNQHLKKMGFAWS
jgi:hypothetical protein